jgi:hypothetical protein
MTAHILRGSKQEIADSLVRINGEVREAIVFVDESLPTTQETDGTDGEDIFAEMRPFMVDVREVDDSREAIYTRTPGE